MTSAEIAAQLRELARAVEDGKYGLGEDIDVDALQDDLYVDNWRDD